MFISVAPTHSQEIEDWVTAISSIMKAKIDGHGPQVTFLYLILERNKLVISLETCAKARNCLVLVLQVGS